MRRRPRPDPNCRSALANPRWFWFWMRYRRTDAAGTRGSAAAAAAVAAAAVVAVFVLAAGRRWPPAAAERTPRRQNCPTKAGWRPGGPPPWPAWPWSWLGYLSKSDERIRMLRGDLQLNLLVPPMRQARRCASQERSDGKTFSGPNCHLTSKPRKPLRTHDDTTTTCCHVLKFKHAFKVSGSKEQEPFSVAAEEKAQRDSREQ